MIRVIDKGFGTEKVFSDYFGMEKRMWYKWISDLCTRILTHENWGITFEAIFDVWAGPSCCQNDKCCLFIATQTTSYKRIIKNCMRRLCRLNGRVAAPAAHSRVGIGNRFRCSSRYLIGSVRYFKSDVYLSGYPYCHGVVSQVFTFWNRQDAVSVVRLCRAISSNVRSNAQSHKRLCDTTGSWKGAIRECTPSTMPVNRCYTVEPTHNTGRSIIQAEYRPFLYIWNPLFRNFPVTSSLETSRTSRNFRTILVYSGSF